VNTEDSLTLPFQVGDLIANKYRMDALLGVGGMGMVLAATHLDLDRKVAVKVIRPELAADEGLVERLLLEARAAAKIKSEHVGRVLDVGRLDDGIPYIVMELLEGQDLGALLERKGTLSIIHAVDLILQACEAVAEAH
jgi:serine/threonine protein kinase